MSDGVERGEARPRIEWERSWHAKREEKFPYFFIKMKEKGYDQNICDSNYLR